VPAMLLVLEGAVFYEQSVEGISRRIGTLEYTEIPSDAIHQIVAELDAYCIIIQ
jgi:hypothetical protein